MDYEKLYKEALERAKQSLTYPNYTGFMRVDVIFPELKESEDKRISREITEFLVNFNNGEYERPNENTIDSWLSWFEKQDKTKQVTDFSNIKTWKFIVDAVLTKDKGIGQYLDSARTETIAKELLERFGNIEQSYILEKQDEQKYDVPDTQIRDSEAVASRMKYIDKNLKPIAEFIIGYANWDLRKDVWNHPVATVPLFRVLDALIQNGKQHSEEHHVVDNKTKPKFKIGDWITNGEYTWKVTDIKSLDYILQSPIYGDTTDDTIYYVDEHFHLWSIEDAKDGDVLASHECYVIFKEIDGLNIKCYCTYHYLGLNPSLYIDTLQNATAFYPATKEQCDFLFKKMKEAGYEWDGDTKQLIKKQS